MGVRAITVNEIRAPKKFLFLRLRRPSPLEICNFGYVGRRELRFEPCVRYGNSLLKMAIRTLGGIHKKRKRQLCRLWMAPYENLVKCSFCPVRDRGAVGIAIGCVSVYLYAFEDLRGFVITKWFFAMVEGILWYLDYIQVFYERLRDSKVNLSYYKWEVSVITKTIFPILVSLYTVLSTMHRDP